MYYLSAELLRLELARLRMELSSEEVDLQSPFSYQLVVDEVIHTHLGLMIEDLGAINSERLPYSYFAAEPLREDPNPYYLLESLPGELGDFS